MKKLQLLLLLAAGQSSLIQAYYFNSTSDGQAVDASNNKADISRVLTSSTFNLSIFDENLGITSDKVMCLADINSGKGIHSVMSANFQLAGGRPSLLALGDASSATCQQLQAAYAKDKNKIGDNYNNVINSNRPLYDAAIKKIAFDALKKQGPLASFAKRDLFVLPAKVTGQVNSNFYVIKTPSVSPATFRFGQLNDKTNGTKAQLVVSGNANNNITNNSNNANTPTPVASNILDFAVAGYDSSFRTRIAVVVSGDPSFNDLQASHSPGFATIRIFLYDSTKSILYDSNGCLQKASDTSLPMSLDTTTNNATTTAHCLGELTGVFSTGINSIAPLYWSNELQRLYFCVNLQSSTPNNQESHSFVVVARFDDSNNLICDSFLPLSDSIDSGKSNVFGFAVQNQYKINDLKIITSLATNASGDKLHYFVASVDHLDNSNRGSALQIDAASRGVYCVPIVDSPSANVADIGKAAKFNASDGTIDRTTPASDASMTYATSSSVIAGKALGNSGALAGDIRSLVGGGVFPGDTRDQSEIKVVSDGVMLLSTGNSLVSNDATSMPLFGSIGAWISKPIYAQDGEIKAWTMWSRALPSGWSAAAELSVTSPCIMQNAFLSAEKMFFVAGSKDGSSANLIGTKSWALPQNNINPFNSTNLFNLITQDFTNTGVWTAKSFSAMDTDGTGKFSLMLLASNEKLSVVATGGNLSNNNYPIDLRQTTDNYATVPFTNADFISKKSQRYQCFNNLDGVGDVLCVEIARSTIGDNDTENNFGHIFVGGANGVAVLRKSDGSGFDSRLSSAAMEDLSSAFSGMSFKKIPEINESIHDMVSTKAFLYLMGKQNIYRIRLHSSFDPALFPPDKNPASSDVANRMFRDDMSVVLVDAREDLSSLQADSGGLELSAGSKFDPSYVVIQKVKTAGNLEYFVNMIGFPNNSPIVIASIQQLSSQLYAVKNGEAPQVEGSVAEKNIYATDTTAPNEESFYKQTLPYQLRKMYLAYSNVTSTDLGDGLGHFPNSNTSNPTVMNSTYGADANGNLLYGPIAGLYVLSGSIFDPHSNVYAYTINGTLDGESSILYLDNEASWISNNPVYGIDGLKTRILANGFAMNGLSYIYAHSNGDMTLSILTLLSKKAPMSQVYSGILGDSKVYGMLQSESGTQMVFGYPFGVATYE